MAAYTPNTGGTVNWDTLTGGSVNATLDTYTISNGTTLLIDTDTYQCANHSTAFGSLDTVSFTGTGGRLLIDGRNVRVIPFNTGSGTVPAIGTTITQGGVTGTLLGVWANWQSEPLAAAAAMPATGFIKIKNKSGGNYAAGALTGITATATGADTTGWIEVRGADTATITVPRIGTFEVIGDWYVIGTTNGARAQIIPCPTTATSSATFPGVQIETAPGSGVYEWFPAAGQVSGTGIRTAGVESKVVWATTTGIRIGNDGTNGVGFLPPTGCRVRIPNVILTCCTRTTGGSGPRVVPNATLATRQEWITTGAGSILMTRCVSNWNNTFAQPFTVQLLDCALADTINISEQSAALNINNIVVSPTAAQINFALNLVSCFGGGTVQNSKFVRVSLASSGSYVCQTNFVSGVTFSGNFFTTLTNRANVTTGLWTATQIQNCTFTSNTFCGGRFLTVGCINNTFTNTSYIDGWTATTGTGNPMAAFDFTAASSGNTVDGLLFPTTNNHPYNALVNLTAAYNTTVKNIGTRGSRLSLGSANQTGLILSSGGNNSGVKLQRIYTLNTRTGLHTLVNSDTGILFESVYGDFADTTAIAGLNAILKGMGQTSATTGQVSVYGTHWLDEFTADTTGRIIALMNEPTATTTAQSQITSGTPNFNSSGQIALTVVGQQLTMEMPYFALGHTAAANLAPTITGTNTGNFTIEFQFDKGAGYNGTWLVANQTNWNSVGTITPSIGIRLRLRVTCATANAGNLLTQVRFDTVSTLTAQTNNLYPLSVNSVQLTGLQANTEVRAYRGTDPATSTEIAGIESTSGSFSFTQSFAGESGYIIIASLGYENINLPITYSATDVSFPIQQRVDRNYANA
jgi:hypothetical protein